MSELRVGDWTVIEDQIMEVTGFAPDGIVIVRPLPPSSEMAPLGLQAGWAGEGAPVPPLPLRPPVVVPLNMAADFLEQIREAMRVAMANPGREIIFGAPKDESEDH